MSRFYNDEPYDAGLEDAADEAMQDRALARRRASEERMDAMEGVA